MAQAWRVRPGLCSVPWPSFLLLQKRALLGADSELRPGATGLSLQRGCCGRGSPPSADGRAVWGPRASISPIPGSMAIAVLVPMPREGDRSPSLLPPPKVPLLLNLFPAPAPSVRWRLGGRSSGAAEESGLPGPFSKLRSVRCLSLGGAPSGPRERGRLEAHRPTPCQTLLLPDPARGPSASQPLLTSAVVLRPDRAMARGRLSVSPHSLPRGPGEAGGPEPASPAEGNGAAGSNREVPAAEGPALDPNSRCRPAPQPRAREQVPQNPSCEVSSLVRTQEGCQRGCWAAAPRGPTGLAGPGGRGRVAPLRQSWGARGQAA